MGLGPQNSWFSFLLPVLFSLCVCVYFILLCADRIHMFFFTESKKTGLWCLGLNSKSLRKDLDPLSLGLGLNKSILTMGPVKGKGQVFT